MTNLELAGGDLTGGHWVTINSARVCIKDGVAIAGPPDLVGKPNAGHANEMSEKASANPTVENHRAAAEAHSSVATAALNAGDKATWEKHADEAFKHYGHSEGWSEGWHADDGGSKWTSGQHDAAAAMESGKATVEKSAGNAAKGATHNRLAGKHKGMSRSIQEKAKSASDKAEDHSFMAWVGKGNAEEHTTAAKAHAEAAKLHAAAGNENDAAYHDNAAAHHRMDAKRASRDGLSAHAIILSAAELHPALPDGLLTHEEIPTDEISHYLNDKPVFKVKAVPVHYYRKELARAGHWTHRGARHRLSGQPIEFDLTTQDFDDAVNNFNDRKDRGILPFIPDSHVEQQDASANNGQIVSLVRDGDGLYATMKLVGEKAIQKILTNDVSVYLVNGNDQLVVDAGTGEPGSSKKYIGRVLHHVALTPDPNQPNLAPFQRIAASADATDVRDVPVFVFAGNLSLGANMACTPAEMAMAKEHLASMGEDASDMDQNNAMGKVMAHAKKMADGNKAMKAKQSAANAVMALSADAELEPAIKTLKADRDSIAAERDRLKVDLSAKSNEVLALSANDPAKLTPWNLSSFEMNVDSFRELAIRNGRVSTADAKSYSALFRKDGKPTALALSASGENGHPLEMNFWRITANLGDGIRTGAVKRDGDKPVDQATQLALDAGRQGDSGKPDDKLQEDQYAIARKTMGKPPESAK